MRIDNDDIIGFVKKSYKKNTTIITSPMQFSMQTTQSGKPLILMTNWLPFPIITMEQVEIDNTKILYTITPSPSFTEYYLNAISGNVKPQPSSNTILKDASTLSPEDKALLAKHNRDSEIDSALEYFKNMNKEDGDTLN